jgi:hypothetical protein
MSVSVKEALKVADILVDGINLAATVVGLGAPAEAVVAALKPILDTLQKGAAGELSPQVALTQLEVLHDGVKADNATADAYAAAKFGASKP